MKKLLALILAFLTSVFSSTEYRVADTKVYTENTFQITDSTLPDYRKYFGGNNKLSATDACDTDIIFAQGQPVKKYAGYWFINGNKYTAVEGDKNAFKLRNNVISTVCEEGGFCIPSGTFKAGDKIIMPLDGYIACHSFGNSVDNIALHVTHPTTGSKYYIKISGMQKWYCDRNRTGEFVYHNGDEQFQKVLPAGAVIGFATEDTMITVKPMSNNKVIDTPLTVKQFYKGKIPEDK